MPLYKSEKRLKVAIIGGGPGGLGAAIELERLPFIDWDLYEKRSKFSEIGGGFTLQPQTWRMLEHNGVADNINAEDYYRSTEGQIEERR
jgi:salicylate hydroxylase